MVLHPSRRTFGFDVEFNTISTPRGSSPVLSMVAVDSKLYIGDGGQGPGHISKMSMRLFLQFVG
jgi:hypothetical protein